MGEDYDLDSGPDPATFAAAAPERAGSDRRDDPVRAVGIGPGNAEYLTPRGERAIREADVVVGFETVVEFVADLTDADLLTCGYRDEAETLERFAERVADGDSGTAVLMGDPNHSGYQFVGKVERAVGDRRAVRVIPGISSLQVAASRARTPMEETTFVTLHKSGDLADDLARLRRDAGDRHLLVLPRPYDWMPGDVAAELLDAGEQSSPSPRSTSSHEDGRESHSDSRANQNAPRSDDAGADASLEALVLERLTHDDEAITRTTLGDLAEHAGGSGPEETPFSDLSVLAVRAESRR